MRTSSINQLDLLTEFIKVVRYKVDIQILVEFIYTNNQIAQKKKNQENDFIHISYIKFKILRRNVAKKVNELYNENYETKSKECSKGGKIPCL